MTKIQELEQKLNGCQKALAELKESKKEGKGKWKPKDDEWYWFVNQYGSVAQTCWNGSDSECDEYLYNHQPIFKTEEECKRYKRFMDTVKEKSYSFSEEEWKKTDIVKYYIRYDYEDNYWKVDYSFIVRDLGKIYFKTEETARHIIDNFKDELMEYFV